jgi:hypothetical protein
MPVKYLVGNILIGLLAIAVLSVCCMASPFFSTVRGIMQQLA